MYFMEKYEEKYTSAYCRLSYDVWYPGYKDCISKYLNKDVNLYMALMEFTIEKKADKVILIDGVACLDNYDLKKFIEVIIEFLCRNEEYSIICALPYEKHKEADRYSYDYISNMLEEMKFIEEIYEGNYILIIKSFSTKSKRYLKLFDDGECSFAIYQNKEIKRGKIKLNANLYKELFDWAKKYISDNIGFFCGMSLVERKRFEVNFAISKFGYEKNDGYVRDDYYFETVEGNGAISKLLQMPELAEFIREEEK